MSDYRIEIKVRNANILRLMENQGIKTVAELCRLTGTHQSRIGKVLNLKASPLLSNGDWQPSVIKICEFFGKMPSDLFSREQMTPLEKNIGFTDVGFEDITQFISVDPVALLENKDIAKAVATAIATLTEQEEKVINLRFGLDGSEHTSREIGELLGISSTYAKSLEGKALRKLRSKYTDN
jgi:RNA polymerase sigma factor (sigma-70 family)